MLSYSDDFALRSVVLKLADALGLATFENIVLVLIHDIGAVVGT